MIRFLGMLVGAALAVAALILVVGLPEFPDKPAGAASSPRSEPDEASQAVAAVVTPRSEPDEASQPVAAVVTPRSEPDEVSQPVGAVVTPRQEPEPEAPPAVLEELSEPVRVALPPTSEATHWYAFWSPFRSELAANGFVAQLQRTTGLDYRVVRQKPGVYEVAFAYSDDADIETKLAQISAATGLDIPES
jgi:hypothetical protein